MALFGKRKTAMEQNRATPKSVDPARAKVEPAESGFAKVERGINFSLPGNPADTVGLFAHYAPNYPEGIGSLGYLIREYLETYGNQFGVTAENPPAPKIYVQLIRTDRIVVRAGSRINEIWRIEVELRSSPDGVQGTTRFFPNWVNGQQVWFVNVIRILGGIQGAVETVGGACEDWR